MKTEPRVFSWQDLLAAPEQTTHWEGVRNYQARNLMRDRMSLGDGVLFYHSTVKPQVIVGIARVIRTAYPDFFAWDASSPYFDPKSSPENPRWVMVDIQAERSLQPVITREEVCQVPELAEMMLLQKGCRLSVQPVTPGEWQAILALRASS
nr:EVE domain-containing protein [Petrachloros mirabilis]